MVRLLLKHKLKTLFISLGIIFITFIFTFWFFFIRIPAVYGHITWPSKANTKIQLVFKGKTYDEVIFGKFNVPDYATKPFNGINIGQVKYGNSPIIIRNVFGHPDMLVGYQNDEMGGWWLFQEER